MGSKFKSTPCNAEGVRSARGACWLRRRRAQGKIAKCRHQTREHIPVVLRQAEIVDAEHRIHPEKCKKTENETADEILVGTRLILSKSSRSLLKFGMYRVEKPQEQEAPDHAKLDEKLSVEVVRCLRAMSAVDLRLNRGPNTMTKNW